MLDRKLQGRKRGKTVNDRQLNQSFLNVGKIVNTHGIRGEVKVLTITDFPDERYEAGNVLYLFHDSLPQPLPVTVASRRNHKNMDILKFTEFNNINEVEKFKGGMLRVAKSDVVPAKEGEYYFHEIIGCRVFTEDEEELGTVTEILQPGANDVWVVRRADEDAEILIPFIEDCVKKVDTAEKRITVHLMEGLL